MATTSGAQIQGNLDGRIAALTQQAEQTAALMERVQNNPGMQRATRMVATQRARGQVTDTVESTAGRGAQDFLQANMLAQGRGLGEAADAAQRLALMQQFAAAANISLGAAAQQLAPQLQQLAQIQEQARRAQANLEGGQMIESGRQEVGLLELRTQHLRDARGIMADMSQEQAHLNELVRRGASAQIVAAARERLGQVQGAREQEDAMRQGRGLREQTRNPLEAFEEERQRLDDLYHRGAITQDVHGRGTERALLQMERAAGEAPAGQAALQEGSAAAASAILRAQRQAQREDRGAALARAVQELRAVQQQSADRQRELVDLVRGGRIFQAANL